MTQNDRRLPVLTLEAGTAAGEVITLDGIPIATYLNLYYCIDLISPERAYELTWLGAWIAGGERPSPEQEQRLLGIIDAIYGRKLEEGWETPEDPIISCTYHMLRSHDMTRKQAARVASQLLGKTITTDTWRLRVDRWAANRNLPKVALRKRRRT